MRIINCKTNHIINPVGYMMENPVFSWQVEDAEGKFQTKARICIARDKGMKDICADTGMTEKADSIATEVSLELEPRTRYYWTVTVQSDAGEEAVSDVNYFETSKMQEPWKAKWIGCERKERHPVFIKDIRVDKELTSARLYICGLGLYEAAVNGKKVSNEYLTPYCNNYEEWLQYQTFDVTEELKNGGRLSVMMGSGWALGRFGFFSKPGDPGEYRAEMELIAELCLTYADGSSEVTGTDETWRVRRSNITFSSIYDGEHRDDTLPDTGEEPVKLIVENTPLTARLSPPVLVQEELPAAELIHTPAGEAVFDIGQNIAGIFRLHVHEPAGTRIHIQFGEVLQEGNFYTENLRTALAEYIYISDGTDKILEPHFTFYGFRYVKIEGIIDLKSEDFTALAVYSDLKQAGRLETGHEKVNRLISNTEWGLKGNFLDVPTDCPQRDERMGWTGDAQVFSPTACFLRDSYAFYRKYLYDMSTEQKNLNGKVPNVIPSFVKDAYRDTGSVWGDAATIIPWNMYVFYGDSGILRERFDDMKAWVDYIGTEDGDSHGWRRRFHNGDWLALDNPAGGDDQCIGGTDTGYIADIYYAYSAEIVAKAAGILGKVQEEEKYRELSRKIRRGVVEEYFSLTGRCCFNTQTALLMALRFDIAPSRDKAREMLYKKFQDTKGKLQTGFVGTPILCSQLTEEGMEGLAYDLLLNEDYPGWLYEINLGATTMWERWNSLNADGTVSSTGMNSFNHYSYGSVVEWMYRYVAGLNLLEEAPGFRQVKIRPVPDRRIGYAHMSYNSAAGCYEISWKADDDYHLTISISVPFGCRAELFLPYAPEDVYSLKNTMFTDVRDGICHLLPGKYQVSYQTTCALRRVYGRKDTVETLLANKGTRDVLEKYMPHLSCVPDFICGMSLEDALRYKDSGLNYTCLLDEIERELQHA